MKTARSTETFSVVNSAPEMVEDLEIIQRASFPTLSEDEIITAAHYAEHIRRFPEGQFAVITREDRVVGCSTDFRTTFDFDHIEHRYIDIVDHNWLGNHDPEGDWLYGADIGVLPEYRGRGIARLLYAARHALVRRLGLKGHLAGSMLRGYGRWKDRMMVDQYVTDVIAGRLVDPALTVHLKCGFRVHGIIQNYVTDPACDNKAALIVWEPGRVNPGRVALGVATPGELPPAQGAPVAVGGEELRTGLPRTFTQNSRSATRASLPWRTTEFG